jgi:hypothetical protein
MLWLRGMAKMPGKIRFCIGPPITPGDCKPKKTNLLVQAQVEDKMNEISSVYKDRARAA